jgi:hypothetical protein
VPFQNGTRATKAPRKSYRKSFPPGSTVSFHGENCEVLAILPNSKVRIATADGSRIAVSRRSCRPLDSLSSARPPPCPAPGTRSAQTPWARRWPCCW